MKVCQPMTKYRYRIVQLNHQPAGTRGSSQNGQNHPEALKSTESRLKRAQYYVCNNQAEFLMYRRAILGEGVRAHGFRVSFSRYTNLSWPKSLRSTSDRLSWLQERMSQWISEQHHRKRSLFQVK